MKQRKKDKAIQVTRPPVEPGRWHVLYPRKVGEVSLWSPLLSPKGERLFYTSQAEAEKKARELSLLNAQVYSVDGDPTALSFVVYDYGVRYVEIVATGERTRMDTAMFDVAGDGGTDLYRLQARKPHNQNNGRFTKWIEHGARDYVDLADAQAEALTLSKDQPRKEFRIVVGESSPRPVVYRGGQPFPDVEVLANLCHGLTPLDDAEALLTLLVEWKGVAQAHSLILSLYGKVTS